MKSFLTLFVVSIFYVTAFAQQPILNENFNAFKEFDASNVKDVTTERGDIYDDLSLIFDVLSEQSTISGFSAAVSLPDGSVWTRASGLSAEVPAIKEMTTEAQIPMGSITKTFIAATMLLMEEDGILSMQDSIGNYLGAYPNIDGSVTIEELLSHSSGFNDYFNENPNAINDWGLNQDSIWMIDDIINTYVLAPNFEPSTSWSYSNTNFLLAGKIIEEITGNAWYEVVRARVIEPLGLDVTYALPFENGDADLLPKVFADIDGDGSADDAADIIFTIDGLMSLASSAGCLVSTPEELTTFVRATFDGQLLSQESIEKMTTNYLPNGGLGFQYGLGALSFDVDLPNWGHNGSVIYQSVALYFPTLDIAIAVQQNEARQGPQFIDLNNILEELLITYINFEEPTSTEGVSFVNFNVFPNPTTEIISYEIESVSKLPSTISILDAKGQLVDSYPLTNSSGRLNVSNFTAGNYILEIGGNHKRFVVQ